LGMAVSNKYVRVSDSGYFYASLKLMKSWLRAKKTKAQYGWRNSNGDLKTRTWIYLLYPPLSLTPFCLVDLPVSAASFLRCSMADAS